MKSVDKRIDTGAPSFFAEGQRIQIRNPRRFLFWAVILSTKPAKFGGAYEEWWRFVDPESGSRCKSRADLVEVVD